MQAIFHWPDTVDTGDGHELGRAFLNDIFGLQTILGRLRGLSCCAVGQLLSVLKR